jgi:hypothetical protein
MKTGHSAGFFIFTHFTFIKNYFYLWYLDEDGRNFPETDICAQNVDE